MLKVHEKNPSKSVLVTGATGFIGSHLVNLLIEKHYKLKIYSRKSVTDEFMELVDDSSWLSGELSDKDRLEIACTGIDIVFHVAGVASSDSSNSEECREVNLIGTQNVYLASVKAGVRKFIYVSSILASDPGSSFYAESKRLSEEFLSSCQRDGAQTKVAILRPASVYGLGMKGSLRTFILFAMRGLIPSLPKIKNSFPLVSVGDLCRALIAVAEDESPDTLVSAFTITDGQEYTVNRVEAAVYFGLRRRKPYMAIPKWAIRLASVIAYLADLTGIKKNRLNLKLDNILLGRGNVTRASEFPRYNFRPLSTLESEMPRIINSMNRK